jgi:hypothetical protein
MMITAKKCQDTFNIPLYVNEPRLMKPPTANSLFYVKVLFTPWRKGEAGGLLFGVGLNEVTCSDYSHQLTIFGDR